MVYALSCRHINRCRLDVGFPTVMEKQWDFLIFLVGLRILKVMTTLVSLEKFRVIYFLFIYCFSPMIIDRGNVCVHYMIYMYACEFRIRTFQFLNLSSSCVHFC